MIEFYKQICENFKVANNPNSMNIIYDINDDRALIHLISVEKNQLSYK